ncbi:MAG: peptide chain release factor aRF-1 [Candidatus Pacearchaeota archaeon]|nr:MAG: peptide chain release factor aRF-1 [Candidatus Pacearchaeota archaeon]
MEDTEREKLKEIVEELEGYRGRHTELITVYASAGSNINQITSQLASEQSTAQNIKSKATKNNVIDALEKMVRHLKLYKKLPENGLALFCGNVSKKEGQPDIKIWAIEPPQPLKTKFYRCDQTFVLDPLKQMLEAKEIYGLIVLDRKEATFGLLEGKSIKTLRHITSGVPGKQRAGGQSALRFERYRESLVKEFFRRISEHVKELFFNKPRLQSLLVGGPGPGKEDWLKEGQLITALKNKIIAVKDIGYADEHGLELLVETSQDILAEEALIKEKVLLEKFFTMLAKESEKIAYGSEQVKKALEMGAVEKLLISTSIDKKIRIELENKAKSIAAEVHLISEETEEGIQFKNLSGIGAILRFVI